MDYVIADHHYDPLHELWRLSIGTVEEHEEEVTEQVYDEQGEPVFEPGETITVTDDDGNDHEHVLVGPPATRTRTVKSRVVIPLEDFAFTALDPRWEGLSEDAIVKEQRKMVRAALRKREKDAEDAAARLSPMPGVGDPL